MIISSVIIWSTHKHQMNQNFHHLAQNTLLAIQRRLMSPIFFAVWHVTHFGYLYNNTFFPIIRDAYKCSNSFKSDFKITTALSFFISSRACRISGMVICLHPSGGVLLSSSVSWVDIELLWSDLSISLSVPLSWSIFFQFNPWPAMGNPSWGMRSFSFENLVWFRV